MPRLWDASGPAGGLVDAIWPCKEWREVVLRLYALAAGQSAGESTTDITEQDGKRIIRRTGMYTGTQLHLYR